MLDLGHQPGGVINEIQSIDFFFYHPIITNCNPILTVVIVVALHHYLCIYVLYGKEENEERDREIILEIKKKSFCVAFYVLQQIYSKIQFVRSLKCLF